MPVYTSWGNPFILMILVIFSVVRKMDTNIAEVFKTLSVPSLIILLLMINFSYEIPEAMVSEIILNNSGKKHKFTDMLGVTYIGICAGVIFPFGGKIPMQSLYLCHRGVNPGPVWDSCQFSIYCIKPQSYCGHQFSW